MLHKDLEYIDYCAFCGCSSLKSITIPPKVKIIYCSTFSGCSALEKVELPDSLTSICNSAFSNCTSLAEIVIPDNVFKIEVGSFSRCFNLKKVVLPKKLKFFGNNVFSECPIESLTVHASYNESGDSFLNRIFNNRDNYKIPNFELTIKYDNYKELYEFIKIITKNNTLVKALNGWCKFNILFDGKKLNFLEQFSIKRLISKHYITKINLSFEVDNKNNNEEKLAIQEHNSNCNLSNEIKSLLKEIDTLSSNLSEELKVSIKQKISKLISDYKIEMSEKNERPKLNLNDEQFELESASLDPETMLFLNLTQIKLDFNSYEVLLKDISSVHKCKKLLKVKVDKKPENLNSLEEIIQTIMYLTAKIDDVKANYYINEIEKILTNTLNKYNSDLDNLFSNNNVLMLETSLTNQQLKVELLKILDELTLYTKKIIPYLEILNVLNNKDVTTYEENSNITNIILGMRYVLLFIVNESSKKELEKEITDFCNEYTTKIENIITNIDNTKESDYRRLEKEIRKRIHPILQKLNIYSSKDKNEQYILQELYNCISILDRPEQIELNNKKALESFIGDIHNTLITNEQILDEERQEIVNKLLEIINNWIEKINKMDKDEDMFMILQAILNDIADVYIKMNNFIKELNKFDNKNYNK